MIESIMLSFIILLFQLFLNIKYILKYRFSPSKSNSQTYPNKIQQ